MNTLIKISAVFAALLLVSACAYSPQQLTINPVIDTTDQPYGNGRSVAVLVEDARSEKVLGSRGGTYKDTSVITIANDLAEAVAGAARAKLAVQGFNVNANNSELPGAQLKIIIDQLGYQMPEQSLRKKVLLSSVLRVEASAGNETYTGRYDTETEKQTLVTPNMEKNQTMINEVLSETLERLFADEKLKTFLSNI